MLLSMRSQRVGHDLATEQQQVLHVTQSLGGVSCPVQFKEDRYDHS